MLAIHQLAYKLKFLILIDLFFVVVENHNIRFHFSFAYFIKRKILKKIYIYVKRYQYQMLTSYLNIATHTTMYDYIFMIMADTFHFRRTF